MSDLKGGEDLVKKYGIIILTLLVFVVLVIAGCEKKAEAPKSTPQPVVTPVAPTPAPAAAPAPAPTPPAAPEQPAKK